MKKSLIFAGVVGAIASFSSFASNTVSVNPHKNNDIAVVTVDEYYKVAFGGKDNLAAYSTELQNIINDDKIKYNTATLNKLLAAALFDKGWDNYHGIDSVTIDGLGQAYVTFGFHNQANETVDSITFFGTDVATWITDNANGNVDIKDKKSRLAMFNANTSKANFYIGGGKSDAKKNISEEFANITGGSKIHGHEIKPLIEALTIGKPASLAGVSLLGITPNSVTIGLHEGGSRIERIVIQGTEVTAAIESLKKVNDAGRPLLDLGDGAGKMTVWDTNSGQSVWLGGNKNQALKALVGGDLKASELTTLVNALFTTGIDGVSIVGLSATELSIRIERTDNASVVDTLIIKGVDLEVALTSYFQ